MIVVIITLLGGSWSSTASDFVQMLLLMPVTVVAAVLALVNVGGVGDVRRAGAARTSGTGARSPTAT